MKSFLSNDALRQPRARKILKTATLPLALAYLGVFAVIASTGFVSSKVQRALSR